LYLTTDAFGGHGGIAKYNEDLLTALCSYPGCEKVVAFPRKVMGRVGPLPDNLDYRLVPSGKLQYIRSLFCFVAKDRKFDLIICGHINLLPLAYVCARVIGVPMLQVIYGIDVWDRTGRWVVDGLASRADHYISISRITGDKFSAWSGVKPSKISVLPNAINLRVYGPGPKPDYLLDRYGLRGKPVIMTLGRMAAEEKAKGFDQIIEALPELYRRFPNLVYLVVGDGSDRSRLEAKVRNMGLKGSVIFPGLVPESEKADHYRLADVYAMPSSLEGFGFVFLEALACGIPVVASKIDGGREALMDGKLGELADPNDPCDIIEKIAAAFKRPRGYISQQLENFSYERYEAHCHEIIERIFQPKALF